MKLPFTVSFGFGPGHGSIVDASGKEVLELNDNCASKAANIIINLSNDLHKAKESLSKIKEERRKRNDSEIIVRKFKLQMEAECLISGKECDLDRINMERVKTDINRQFLQTNALYPDTICVSMSAIMGFSIREDVFTSIANQQKFVPEIELLSSLPKEKELLVSILPSEFKVKEIESLP